MTRTHIIAALGGLMSALLCLPAAAQDRGVYVNQIGTANSATIDQTARRANAVVVQDGDRNDAKTDQRGTAAATIDLRQTGMLNVAGVVQDGTIGTNTLYAVQNGAQNQLTASQSATDGANGAALMQQGNGNAMQLTQSDGDNLASLTQIGDNNAMTASQSGIGNRLTWTQQGNNLSNIAISQTGGQTMQVTQNR